MKERATPLEMILVWGGMILFGLLTWAGIIIGIITIVNEIKG